jgi:predicted nucleic acid-binding protein
VTRYTIDASVFVNAFNPHEDGHARSLEFLTAVRDAGDPVLVPTLMVVEVAAAAARASGDAAGALAYALAAGALPHITLVSLTSRLARQAAELAVTHRLRGADAVYLIVARRYGAMLVSRDQEQRARGAAITTCRTPDEALARRS